MPDMVGGEELYHYLRRAYGTELRKIRDMLQKYQGNISQNVGLFRTNHHKELFINYSSN